MSNIKLISGMYSADVKFTTFSDGSETCKIEGSIHPTEYISVNINIKDCTRDLVRICLVKDMLGRMYTADIRTILHLSYMPQARADRVFEKGMPLPVKVFADIINSCNFSEVIIDDPHSDVTPAVLNNCRIIDQATLVRQMQREFKTKLGDFKLCAPDLGAAKKVFDVAQALGHTDWIQGIKIRDVTTGNIVKCDIQNTDDLHFENVLIVDDLSDGGASFAFLAHKLREYGVSKIGLYVTHGIFAKGLTVMKPEIDFIWCHNIIGDYINKSDLQDFNEDV